MIAIIDYGVGNLGSIRNMLKKAGAPSLITSDAEEIRRADKLILPGVGAFDYGMQQLNDSGLIPILNQRVLQDKVPILGICLGVQLFTRGSEEGKLPGLGWVDADTKRFDFEKMDRKDLKIPHMGWTDVYFTKDIPLFKEMYEAPRFYFVHTYHLLCDKQEEVLVKANYGYEFAAGIKKENIIGLQFHPEKSHKYGTLVFKNFHENY